MNFIAALNKSFMTRVLNMCSNKFQYTPMTLVWTSFKIEEIHRSYLYKNIFTTLVY
jgi:hypothetical protein